MPYMIHQTGESLSFPAGDAGRNGARLSPQGAWAPLDA